MPLDDLATVVGLPVSAAGVYIAYLTVPADRLPRWMPGLSRRRRRPPVAPPATPPASDGDFEVFVSYTEPDAPIAEQLARGLQAAGLRIFLTGWVEPGLVTSMEADEALRVISHGVLLFSEATQRDPRVMDDYAAALRRIHTGGRRLIPVLVGQAREQDLPPLIRIRRPLDLRGARDTEIDQGAMQLANIIRRDRSL